MKRVGRKTAGRARPAARKTTSAARRTTSTALRDTRKVAGTGIDVVADAANAVESGVKSVARAVTPRKTRSPRRRARPGTR